MCTHDNAPPKEGWALPPRELPKPPLHLSPLIELGEN